jgi:endonuclease/exonuclease/phosphatase family metal-dependent hydrolase
MAQEIKVITYNIRLDVASDGLNQWGKRTESVKDLLKKSNPDVLCIQEGLFNQMNDLQNMLPDYFYVGVGRDDGDKKGEFSAIFFRKNKFDLISSNTFWLSPTPEISGSKGWDAAITRICSYGEVKLKDSGKSLFIFNTHFDHIGVKARKESSKLIIKKVAEIAKDGAVILTGDFNSEPSTKAFKTIVKNKAHPLKDSYIKSDMRDCTFTGFKVSSGICKHIDFIFYDNSFKQKSYQIIIDNNGTYYPSDHLPVASVLILK